MNPRAPFVSLVVVVRNGQAHIRRQLCELLAIDYPAESYEILVIDGVSDDGTRQVAKAFETGFTGRVRVLENPRRTLGPGWNIGIAASRGEIVLRVDVHCSLAANYVRTCVARLLALEASGVRVAAVGGRVEMVAGGDGVWARAIAAAWNSRIGAGRPAYRTDGVSRPVDALALAAFRRQVLQDVGGLDERFGRTEDNVLFHRLNAKGYRLHLASEARARYMVRSTVSGLFRQMFANGRWLIPTWVAVRNNVFSIRHFLPALAGALGVLLLSVPQAQLLLLVTVLAYLTSVGIGAGLASRRCRAHPAAVACAVMCMHAAYSLGTLYGALEAAGRSLASSGRRPRYYSAPPSTGEDPGGR